MRVDNKSFYADLFTKSDGPNTSSSGRREHSAPAALAAPVAPRAIAPPAALVPVEAVKPPVNDEAAAPAPTLKVRSALRDLIGDVDIHHLSPRKMSDLSLNLYAAGAISFEDYSALAFQPELHPDYDRTIGALTGERADPDRPRDFVRLWDDRADFQRRHDTSRRDLVEQSERIASVLRQIETPLRMAV